jgi:hypothetical protein
MQLHSGRSNCTAATTNFPLTPKAYGSTRQLQNGLDTKTQSQDTPRPTGKCNTNATPDTVPPKPAHRHTYACCICKLYASFHMYKRRVGSGRCAGVLYYCIFQIPADTRTIYPRRSESPRLAGPGRPGQGRADRDRGLKGKLCDYAVFLVPLLPRACERVIMRWRGF